MKKYLLPYKNATNTIYDASYREDLHDKTISGRFYVWENPKNIFWHNYIGDKKLFDTRVAAEKDLDKDLIGAGWTLLPDKLKVLL